MLKQALRACSHTIDQSTTVLRRLASIRRTIRLTRFLTTAGAISPVARAVVVDNSMQPTLVPGDRLLVLRWSLRLRPGDVVVAWDPQRAGQWIVKRVGAPEREGVGVAPSIAAVPAGHFLLLGDNAGLSRDSREFGPVHRSRIVGRVVWRYLPAHRRGALRPPETPRP